MDRFSLDFSSRTNALVGNAIHLGGYNLAWTTARELPATIGVRSKLFSYFGVLDHIEYVNEIEAQAGAHRKWNCEYDVV
jgi:hypothetical protein